MGDAGVGWVAAIIIGGIAGWLATETANFTTFNGLCATFGVRTGDHCSHLSGRSIRLPWRLHTQ
jgi:hypothetical protein